MVSWLKLDDRAVRRLFQARSAILHAHASREELATLAGWLSEPELQRARAIEACHRWIAFLPDRTNGSPARPR